MLVKNPGFSAVAILALGLGIGVNSMMFTIYNAALLKSLPFDKPEQVVHVYHRNLVEGGGRRAVSYDDFLEYRQSKSFKAVAALSGLSFNVSDDRATPERLTGSRITSNLFSLIGQKPHIGRDFTEADEKQGADPVVLMSYGIWQTRYGADPAILGKSVKISERFYTIIGVMAEGMEFPEASRAWLPLIPSSQERENRVPFLQLFGRLNDDVSIRQSQIELQGSARNYKAAHPEINKNLEPMVITYTDYELDSDDQAILKTLLGAVTFVLLIACSNVANLLLSRAVHRTRETSIRISVGAGRWQIIRQLLTESVILSLCGALMGLGFALVSVRLFAIAVTPLGLPYWIDWSMDVTTFSHLLAVSVATGVLFGIAPALQISRTNVIGGLKETGRGTSGGVHSKKLTTLLVVAEIALTIILMVGAGLMVRSLMKRYSVSIGVNPHNLIGMQMVLAQAKYPQPADRETFERRLVERLRSISILETFTIASNLPLGGSQFRNLKLADHDITDKDGKAPGVSTMVVEPGYFQALGLTLLRGREFNSNDGGPGSEAAIVNQRFASTYWPNEDAIGRKIQLDEKGPWVEIVGISPPVRQSGLRQSQVDPMVYIPFRQSPLGSFRVMARSRAGEEAVARALREEVRNIDPDLPLFNIGSVETFINEQSRGTRILSIMFSIFALIALVMSSVGIYAVTAYAASQRTQEIGVRVALGADKGKVIWLVLRSGLKQLAIGLPLGLAGAFFTSRALSNELFEVSSSDPATFLSIPALLTIIIIAACLIPALRAARLNPVDALRSE